MKLKIIIAVLLGLSALAFVYKGSEKEINNAPVKVQTTGGFNDNFFIGALNCGAQTYYNQYSELGFNLWSCYRDSGGEKGWTKYSNLANDLRTNPVSQYQAGLVSLYNDNLTQHGMRTLMDRTKITFLGYGARSDYQCESENYLGPEHQDYKFYTYGNHGLNVSTDYTDNIDGPNIFTRGRYSTPNNTTDGGITFLQHNPGYVVQGLVCNREQASMGDVQHPERIDWIDDYKHTWKVKPRIRIDPEVAHSQDNPFVCKIEIIKWDGTELRHIDIRSNYFLDEQTGEYNGEYIDKFNLPLSSPKLDFGYMSQGGIGTGDEINPQNLNVKDYSSNCQIDFRVWWYGNCDMWIDRVRVEDEIASDLFADPPNSNTILYNQWIKNEVEAANQSQGPLAFYMEEWDFNHLPCMKYLADKLETMPENTNHYGLMAILNWQRMFSHIPPTSTYYNYYINGSTEDINYIKRVFIEPTHQKQIYLSSYPFEGDKYEDPPYSGNYKANSPIPVTLCGEQHYNSSSGMLTESVTPSAYEQWLQTSFDKDWGYWSYTLNMKIAHQISADENIPFVNLVQTHLQ